MDKHFLEFWGNYFLNAARGQKQFEDMAKWMGQGFGFDGLDELSKIFAKSYGLAAKESDGFPAWTDAVESFQKSLRDLLPSMGVVPKTEYVEILKKYEALKEKCERLEETVENLRSLLAEGSGSHDAVVGQLQDIMSKQSEQFQSLMESTRSFFETAVDTSGKKGAK